MKPSATARKLRAGLYMPIVTRSCGHVFECRSLDNTEAAALRAARYMLEHCVCSVCRRGERSGAA